MIDVVAGVIEDGESRILACQRPEGKHLAGKWEFPGGKVEPGETPEAALIRELQEELNITVRTLAPLSPVVWDYGRGPIRLLPFRCCIEGGEPRAMEHAELRWVDFAEAMALEWAAADGPVLQELWVS